MKAGVANADIVRETRAHLLDEATGWIDAVIGKAESPIEAAVLLALLRSGEGLAHVSEAETYEGIPGAESAERTWFRVVDCNHRGKFYDVIPQVSVQHGGQRFRVDIAIRYPLWAPEGERRKNVWVAVECDGHAYHERTKEQAEKDKAKDRALQSLGWRVARFTGSQIVRDPAEVAFEIEMFCADQDFLHYQATTGESV